MTASVEPIHQTTNHPTVIQTIIKKRLIGKVFLIAVGILAFWYLMTGGVKADGVGLLDNPVLFLQQVLNGLQLGFVYALIALGYTMVYGIVRLINFAHGDVFMVGAFVSFYAIDRFALHTLPARLIPGLPSWLSIGIGTILVILTPMIICPIMAFTIERIAYKPLRNAPRISALITAIGISFFLEYFGAMPFVFGPNFITYQRPFSVVNWQIGGSQAFMALKPGQAPESGAIIFSNIALIIIVVSVLLLLVLNFIVKKTKVGKAMRATAYDKPTSRLMGINVDGIISITFAIGAALAGAAGMLYAIAFPQIYFAMGITPGLKAFVAAVLGGIGSIPGALVGALILGQAEVLSAAYISTPMRDAVAFTLLVVVLLVRPTGIFGEPTREKA
jgi:branched-chain amino acid transport system permease protein